MDNHPEYHGLPASPPSSRRQRPDSPSSSTNSSLFGRFPFETSFADRREGSRTPDIAFTPSIYDGSNAEEPRDRFSALPDIRPVSEEVSPAEIIRNEKRSKRATVLDGFRKLQGWWFWELGGITLSISCMTAILVLLPYLENRLLDDWKFFLAPNTMISTFITVAKTSMLLAITEGISQLKWQYFMRNRRRLSELDIFDEASRGPWGSLMFMLKMCGKSGAVFAMLGAFVVVASLTLEPFAQQILSFESRSVESASEVATFSILRMWESNGLDSKVQEGMKSAFVKGLVNSPPPLTFTCSSGNCTWPEFSALGICSSCADVTKHSKNTSLTTASFNNSTAWDTAFEGPRDDCETLRFSTPNGLLLFMSKGCYFRYGIYQQDGYCNTRSSVIDGPAPSPAGDGPVPPAQRKAVRLLEKVNPPSPTLVATTTASSHAHNLGPILWMYSPDGDLPTPRSTDECSNTIQQLPTSIASNAKYADFNNNVSESAIIVLAVSRTKVDGKGTTGRISGPTNVTDCQLSWCEKVFSNVKVANGVMAPFNTIEKPLNKSQLEDRISYWKSWSKHNRKVSYKDFPKFVEYIASQMNFTVPADIGDVKFGPGSAIIDTGNITKVMENVAEALTRQLYIGDHSTQQAGTAYAQKVFIRVRWEWAVFPVVLVLLGVIFLVINWWINHKDKVSLWKSSLLPLLFHGLDGWDENVLDVTENVGMTSTAKNMYAKLERNDVGSTKLVST